MGFESHYKAFLKIYNEKSTGVHFFFKREVNSVQLVFSISRGVPTLACLLGLLFSTIFKIWKENQSLETLKGNVFLTFTCQFSGQNDQILNLNFFITK